MANGTYIAFVVAMTHRGLIGNSGGLPWDLPEERNHFRKLTRGHTVIMGRKTMVSIGKPLKGRSCIVLSRSNLPRFHLPGGTWEVCSSLSDALEAARRVEGFRRDRVWVIGGASVYEQFLPLASEMHVSWVEGDFPGDVYFPAVDWGEWKSVKKERREGFEYEVLARK